MWTTMSREERIASDLKCFALGAACMAVLLIMMLI